jgi:hypothetical protein
MRILIQTPICLLMAIARYGITGNTFILVSGNDNPLRHRGRDLNLRREITIQILESLQIPYQEMDCDNLAIYLRISKENLAVDFQLSGRLWQLGLLPINTDMSSTRQLELLSFGADNLLPFSDFSDNFRSLRAFRDNRIWSEYLRSILANKIIVPSTVQRPTKIFASTELQTIEVSEIKKVSMTAVNKVLSQFLWKIDDPSTKSLIVVAPDNIEISSQHVFKISEAVNKLSLSLNNEVNVLIKPHPSTLNASELIESISSLLLIEPINIRFNIAINQIQAIPIEFFYLKYPNSHYVGVPSSSISFLDKDKIQLVETGNRKLDSLYRRNYRFFLQFHGFN